MIKQLVNLVMPKPLTFLATALALGSTAYSIFDSGQREDEINDAQNKKSASDRLIRQEQAGRARRKQIRDAQVAQAQSENVANSSGNAATSGAINAVSAVQTSTADNLGEINTGLATGNINAVLTDQIKNAGRPSDFSLFNSTFIQPAANTILTNSITNAFKPDPIPNP